MARNSSSRARPWLPPLVAGICLIIVTAAGAGWGWIAYERGLQEQTKRARAKLAAEQAEWERAQDAIQNRLKTREHLEGPHSMRPSLVIRNRASGVEPFTNTSGAHSGVIGSSSPAAVKQFSVTRNGIGTTTTDRIALPAGVLIVRLTASGKGNAILKIVPLTGRSDSDNSSIINEIVDGGSRTYSTTLTVETAGDFILEYKGDTSWTASLSNA